MARVLHSYSLCNSEMVPEFFSIHRPVETIPLWFNYWPIISDFVHEVIVAAFVLLPVTGIFLKILLKSSGKMELTRE